MAKKAKGEQHGTRDIQAQLDALEEEGWDDTKENEGGFAEVPTGDYQVKFNKVTINNSKSSGRLQVSFDMTIVGAEDEEARKLKNRKLFKHEGLDTDENRGKLRYALAKLGQEWPKASDLPATLEELVGTHALVHVNTKPSSKEEGQMSSWTNFVKAIDEDEIEDELEEDDEDEKSKKGKKKPAKEEDDEDEEEEKPKKKAKKPEPEEEDEEDEEDEEEEKPAKKGKKKPADDDEEDEDDEDDEEEEKPAKKKGKVVEEPEVKITFEEDDIDAKQKKAIAKLAETLEFDADNYDDQGALLVDMAEHVGLSGSFSSPAKLIAKVTEKAENEEEDEDDE